MKALNRYFWPTKFKSRSEFLKQGVKCVFVSYQNADKQSAKKIADYLLSAGINVYFDEYDKDLKSSNQTKNPKRVTNALIKGINTSSHMLVLVSPSTLKSQWVPFEIGYGNDKTNLNVLTLKGISKGKLPEYIRTAKIIRDIWDINSLISSLRGISKDTLITLNTIKDDGDSTNPLRFIMDPIVSENY